MGFSSGSVRSGVMRRRSRLVAFTLVELLVVVGVIALLIGILVPTLSKARTAARTTACLSNLRQLGNALLMYSVDSHGLMPYPTTASDPSAWWYNAVDKYLQT